MSSSFRRAIAAAGLTCLVLVASACGSDSDADDATSGDTVAAVVTEVEVTTPGESDSTTPVATEGDASPACNGLSAAEVSSAAGGDFDAADDVSADADHSCLFSNSTTGDGVVVLREGTATFLAGSLDGVSSDEALTVLEASYATVMDDFAAERTTIAGSPAVVVTGTGAITGTPMATAATVIDGELIEVSADGTGLAADAAGFGAVVTAVLELAVAAKG